jgi:hypothetical protein
MFILFYFLNLFNNREPKVDRESKDKKHKDSILFHIFAYIMDETNCKYVSSRGLLKSCDITYSQPISSIPFLPDFSKMYNGCSVYVCNDAIQNLAKVIHLLNHRFILVSGDADTEIYKNVFSSLKDFKTFIENEKIIHWFSQNSNISHPKLTNLPIGLDYHSNVYSYQYFHPIQKEQILSEIKNKSIPFYNRIPKCYINFCSPPNFYKYKQHRQQILQNISKELIFREQENQNVFQCWTNQIEYAFVISPFGNGMDCHRTWEALILGCIPIVYSCGLDSLFEDLPVLIVKDWNEITQELLDNTIETFKKRALLSLKQVSSTDSNLRPYDYNKLTLSYWKNKINSYK